MRDDPLLEIGRHAVEGAYQALGGFDQGLRKVGARVFDPTVPVTSLLPEREDDEEPRESSRAA